MYWIMLSCISFLITSCIAQYAQDGSTVLGANNSPYPNADPANTYNSYWGSGSQSQQQQQQPQLYPIYQQGEQPTAYQQGSPYTNQNPMTDGSQHVYPVTGYGGNNQYAGATATDPVLYGTATDDRKGGIYGQTDNSDQGWQGMTIGDNQGLYGRNGGNNQDLYDRAADNNQGLYDSTTAQAPFLQPSSTYGIDHHQNQGRLDLYNQHNDGNYRNDPMLSPTTGSYDPANPYFQVQSGCDADAQQKLETCSQELVTTGVLDSRSSNPLQQIAFGAQHLSAQHSNEFILKICAAYDRFNQCVDGGSSVKHFCYALHPLKIRYGITDAALNYICGQGYKSMLSNWKCIAETLSRPEAIGCEQRMTRNSIVAQMNSVQPVIPPTIQRNSSALCNSVQSYIRCIRDSLDDECGYDATNTAIKVIERKTRTVSPECTVSSGTVFLPSLLLILLSLLTFSHS